jgi:hypothetical protein
MEGTPYKAPVKGRPITKEEKQRKGLFLIRFYGRQTLPDLKTASGKPTKFALAAKNWGYTPPKTHAECRELARLGRKYLEQSKNQKDD